MKHIAILGGGIAGLAAAYELELARKRGAEIDWHLYEASSRLGGTVETTQQAGFTLEGGPDGWITEKPWARDLAIELGLKADLIESNDATRKTYILVDGRLQPMPGRMRMMVPEDLSTLDSSPLFSEAAKAAYAAELVNAAQLREAAPKHDESVASFVLRHFGEEVLTKIGAPLLSGVFGGDVAKLSVNAVMAPFVKMEREHGSLIAALQSKSRKHGDKPRPAIFTSLRNGLGSLTAALIATLPPERLHLSQPALSLKRQGNRWLLRTTAFATPGRTSKKHFHHVLIATPIDAARDLLHPLDAAAAALIPTDASSAVLATFCWPAETAADFTIPPGFGFLVPQSPETCHPENLETCHPERSEGPASQTAQDLVISTEAKRSGETSVFIEAPMSTPPLLAATFVDQKFPHRAPTGARILRAFFGTGSAEHFAHSTDADVAAAAFSQLTQILGPLPDPTFTTVRRWPRSLPQYEVGHPERMAALDDRIAKLGGLTLLGNGYRGVGLPDLIHASRNAANKIASLHP